MPRIKRIIPNGFTTVNNDFLRDVSLSIAARGLLITMLSLPDGWNMSGRGLAAILPDGKDRVFTALRALEEKGYLKRETIRENGKFVDTEYQFCDSPVFKEENEKKRASSSPKKKRKKKPEEDKRDFSVVSEKEEITEECDGAIKNKEEERILEKKKCMELGVSEEIFTIIANVFSEIYSSHPEMRDILSKFDSSDVVWLSKTIKDETEPEWAIKRYFVKACIDGTKHVR